jgi:hypothetical protein
MEKNMRYYLLASVARLAILTLPALPSVAADGAWANSLPSNETATDSPLLPLPKATDLTPPRPDEPTIEPYDGPWPPKPYEDPCSMCAPSSGDDMPHPDEIDRPDRWNPPVLPEMTD